MTPWVILAAAVLVTFFGCGWGIEYRNRLAAQQSLATLRNVHASDLALLAASNEVAELWRARALLYHPGYVESHLRNTYVTLAADTSAFEDAMLRVRASLEGIGGPSL